MANPSRYRYIDFIGGEILQAREMSLLQRIQEGLNSGGTTRVAYNLDMIYREGATFNVLPTLVSTVLTIGTVNPALPMYIFVRGQWEVLQSSEIGSSLTIPSSGGNVYLNWALRQVTSAEDPTLIDTSTSQPTADMGELDLSVSVTDTSGTAISGTQFEKNTVPIIIFTFNSAGSIVPIDNVNHLAWGTLGTSGLVSLSTSTSNGVACSTDDPRLVNGRAPSAGTVIDASVRTPISPGGTNTDGTTIYNLTGDPGGISAAKIVHLPGTQLVSDAIQWVKGQITSILGTLTSHIGVQLGSVATHPMPTAAQVGAAPLSHVGLPLGLPTSHPATVTTNSGGFSLNRDSTVTPAANDPAYGVFGSTEGLITGLLHNGDILVSKALAITASPIAPATTTGSLESYLTLANVLAQHVNQTSHANPHGLVASDIGALTNSNFTPAVLSQNGYIPLPGGLLLQWKLGVTTLNNSRQNFTENWPKPFPNSCFVVLPVIVFDTLVTANWQGVSVYLMPGTNKTSVEMYADEASSQNVGSNWRVFMFGIGN